MMLQITIQLNQPTLIDFNAIIKLNLICEQNCVLRKREKNSKIPTSQYVNRQTEVHVKPEQRINLYYSSFVTTKSTLKSNESNFSSFSLNSSGGLQFNCCHSPFTLFILLWLCCCCSYIGIAKLSKTH